MRASCPDRRVVAAAALAVWLPGCVSGQLLAAARRREYAREIHTVAATDAGTVVRYTADVVDDDGVPAGVVVRTVRLDGKRAAVERRELTRIRTAAWFYAVLPVTLALDTVVTPIIVLLAPAPLLMGD